MLPRQYTRKPRKAAKPKRNTRARKGSMQGFLLSSLLCVSLFSIAIADIQGVFTSSHSKAGTKTKANVIALKQKNTPAIPKAQTASLKKPTPPAKSVIQFGDNITTLQKVKLMTGPSFSSEMAGTLPQGQNLKVARTRDGWVAINGGDALYWISTQHLKRIK